MSKELIEKIEDLETRLSFQDDLLSAMNMRVTEQDTEIAKLQLQLQHINQKLKESHSLNDGENSVDEKPPHY